MLAAPPDAHGTIDTCTAAKSGTRDPQNSKGSCGLTYWTLSNTHCATRGTQYCTHITSGTRDAGAAHISGVHAQPNAAAAAGTGAGSSAAGAGGDSSTSISTSSLPLGEAAAPRSRRPPWRPPRRENPSHDDDGCDVRARDFDPRCQAPAKVPSKASRWIRKSKTAPYRSKSRVRASYASDASDVPPAATPASVSKVRLPARATKAAVQRKSMASSLDRCSSVMVDVRQRLPDIPVTILCPAFRSAPDAATRTPRPRRSITCSRLVCRRIGVPRYGCSVRGWQAYNSRSRHSTAASGRCQRSPNVLVPPFQLAAQRTSAYAGRAPRLCGRATRDRLAFLQICTLRGLLTRRHRFWTRRRHLVRRSSGATESFRPCSNTLQSACDARHNSVQCYQRRNGVNACLLHLALRRPFAVRRPLLHVTLTLRRNHLRAVATPSSLEP